MNRLTLNAVFPIMIMLLAYAYEGPVFSPPSCSIYTMSIVFTLDKLALFDQQHA